MKGIEMSDRHEREGRIQKVRHELKIREVEVARVEPLGPEYVSVTFRDESLADFISPGYDDHVKFMLPGPDGQMVRRDYTPRRFDREARELTLEFALHDAGAASDWARQAAPGQRVTIGGPKGSMIVPLDYDWQLLAGDATALPAIRRRLEELPAGARVMVIVAGSGAQDFATQAALELRQVAGSAALVETIRALDLPPGDGFVWCGGEATMAKTVRHILQEKDFPREASRVSAYWKQGASDHHENL
jgi:NADPH-dependent ferric siderophore reductase